MKKDIKQSWHYGPPTGKDEFPEIALCILFVAAVMYSCSVGCVLSPSRVPEPEWNPKVYELHVHKGKCSIVYDEFGEPYEEFACGDFDKTRGLIIIRADSFIDLDRKNQRCVEWK